MQAHEEKQQNKTPSWPKVVPYQPSPFQPHPGFAVPSGRKTAQDKPVLPETSFQCASHSPFLLATKRVSLKCCNRVVLWDCLQQNRFGGGCCLEIHDRNRELQTSVATHIFVFEISSSELTFRKQNLTSKSECFAVGTSSVVLVGIK